MESNRDNTLADVEAYRRGMWAAVAGGGIQLALVLAMALASVWTQSPALYAATWHMLGGMPIWVILVVLYHQYQLERRESLAAAKVAAADAASAAIFGDIDDELLAIRNRLQRLLGLGLSIVSFIVALYLVGVGIALSLNNLKYLTESETKGAVIAAGVNPVGLMFAMGAFAFIAFITARWISGYAKVSHWQLLRGGASYLMSCVSLAGLLFIGAILAAILEDLSMFRWLAALVPLAMVLVGLEILLTALLSVYRPRRPDEMVRPAFDSRVLGLLTSPESLSRVLSETLNYQFGVEISRSWLYGLLGEAVTPLAIFATVFMLALSCVVIVEPHQQAVVLQGGQMVGSTLGPGFHLKLPWPVQTVDRQPVGRVHAITITSDIAGKNTNRPAMLWTSDSDTDAQEGQEFYVTAPNFSAEVGDGKTGASGLSVISAEVVVQFRVADLGEFLLGSANPRQMMRVLAEHEVNAHFASSDIDALLATSRLEGGRELERRIQARIDELKLGLRITGVAITALQPPMGRVSRAFHSQIGAVQEKETRIQEALKDAAVTRVQVAGSVELSNRLSAAIMQLDNLRTELGAKASTPEGQAQLAVKEQQIETLLAEAKGDAAGLVHKARATRWQRAASEAASAERFLGELLAYQAAPSYYRARKFLDVLSEGLAGRRKYVITGDGRGLPVLQMDFNDSSNAVDTLLGPSN